MNPRKGAHEGGEPRSRLGVTRASEAATDLCKEATLVCQEGLRAQGTSACDAPVVPTRTELQAANECLVLATVNAQAVVETVGNTLAELSYLADHDVLTGLPNRALLADRLAQAIAQAKRHAKTVALMYLDLDAFKQVNDSLGHAVGDQLLQSVANRIQRCVRHSDTVTVSRHGGDEFVLLPEVEAMQDAITIAQKIIRAMAQPHLIEGHRIQVTMSIGISLFPDDGEDAAAVIRHADTAMYHAKSNGRNNYQIFTQGMERPAVPRQSGEEAAHRGLPEPSRTKADSGVLPPGATARLHHRYKLREIAIHRAQLREANEHLVLATVEAQKAAEAAAQSAYRAELENQLLESQKLETLGVLAGGVAHDFNNLLTTILGNVDLGRAALDRGEDVKRFFDPIEKAAMKAGELTRQLLAYAGKGKFVVSEVDLTSLAKEVTQILSVSTPPHVVIHKDLADRLPYVKGDGTQILQILMNLITNAFESFPEGVHGQVTIRTRAEGAETTDLGSDGWVLPLTPGRYACLEVVDTGSGMTPEVKSRIFEPFFSTKFTGRGLGLAAVMGIIRSHGGGLKVESEPDHGTALKIYLPAMQEARSMPVLETLPAWRGNGLVLIVDEDPLMRKTARHMAERLGFSVTEAGDGPEAIKTFSHHHEDLALVLMDLNLPRMDGRAAVSEMQKIDRKVPLLSSSGYREPAASPWANGLLGDLKKPYRLAEFQGLVQRTLAQA